MCTLVIYNRHQARELLRHWTTQQLLEEINAGRCNGKLSEAECTELATLARAWMHRALGPLTLRDALLVDPRRGARVYDLLCKTLTVERYVVPPAIAELIEPADDGAIAPEQVRLRLEAATGTLMQKPEQREHLEQLTALASVIDHAEATGLALACYAGETAHYPFPDDLDALLPVPPPPFPQPVVPFEQPIGWRRRLAMGSAFLGVAFLGVPLVMGRMPAQPAGLPLALLTIALLVGIKAGWAGFAGSLCIWLVANLPGFHHDTVGSTLWPGVPLLVVGVILLSLDRHVRAMWHWLRLRLMGRVP